MKMAAQSYTKRLVLRELELIKYNEFNISLILKEKFYIYYSVSL